jgi:uncharacterized protein YndB with AHSA1/START domain
MTTHVYRVFIKATPQAIWDAITQPEWSTQYGYGGFNDYELKPGGRYISRADEPMKAAGAPDILVDGEVIEVDPPRKLVQTWRMLMDPSLAEEGFTKLTYEIDERKDGLCRLTVVHDLTGAPGLAKLVEGDVPDAGGGWPWVLSSLKTLLETGKQLEWVG